MLGLDAFERCMVVVVVVAAGQVRCVGIPPVPSLVPIKAASTVPSTSSLQHKTAAAVSLTAPCLHATHNDTQPNARWIIGGADRLESRAHQ